MDPCIFCPNPRTRKRGEHVWDDWLNREGGKDIKAKSTTSPCNNTWMSELSGIAKELLEPIIRRGTPRDFDHVDLLTIAAFAFLKSAVLDWSAIHKGRVPCLSRTICVAFRHSRTSQPFAGDIALPDGLQVWIAKYLRTRRMEALTFTEELTGVSHLKGYKILSLHTSSAPSSSS